MSDYTRFHLEIQRLREELTEAEKTVAAYDKNEKENLATISRLREEVERLSRGEKHDLMIERDDLIEDNDRLEARLRQADALHVASKAYLEYHEGMTKARPIGFALEKALRHALDAYRGAATGEKTE